MGKNMTLSSLLRCKGFTCKHAEAIIEAAQRGNNRAMFKPEDIREAKRIMGEQGFEIGD